MSINGAARPPTTTAPGSLPVGGNILMGHPVASTTRRAFLGAGLATVAGAADCRAGRDRWSIAPSLPFAVQEIYLAVFQDQIILAGGIIDDAQDGIGASARTIIYQPGKNAWIEGPPLPRALHHPGLVSTPDRVLAIGGFATGPAGFWQMQNGVSVLDRELSSWASGPDLPRPRAEFVSVHLGDYIILTGGRTPAGSRNLAYDDHLDTADTLLADPTTSLWRSGRPAPTARNSAAGAVLNGMLHVVGGRVSAGGHSRNLDAHEAYDPVSDQWSMRAPMPQAQGGLAAAALNNRLYAFGGEFFDSGSGVFKEVWAYDPIGDRWEAASSMPVPRHGLGAVTLTSGIHVLGGATRAGASARSARHDMFRHD